MGVVVVVDDGELTNDQAQLADLREKHPLPDDVDDAVVNLAQLAVAMNVSGNTVSKWITAGLPQLEGGGNGREYQFRLADCYAWRMDRDVAEQARRAGADRAASQMALLFQNEDEDSPTAGMTPKAIKEMAEADYAFKRAAEQRGELVRADRVRLLFEDVAILVRQGITSVVDYAEKEYALTPEQVEALQRRMDQILIQMRIDLGAVVTPRGEVQAIRPEQDALNV